MSLSLTAPTQSSFSQQTWCVLKAWLRNPAQVAMICPSSPYLTKHLANRDCVRQATNVIELGPGAGGTTRALLSQMRGGTKLLAIEKTPDFAEALQAIGDPRLITQIGDACELVDIVKSYDFGLADVVVSGIPFSCLPEMAAKRITQSVHEVLRPGGVFVAYQLRSEVKLYARPLFGPPKTETIAINLPPLQAFVWTKFENDGLRKAASGAFNS